MFPITSKFRCWYYYPTWTNVGWMDDIIIIINIYIFFTMSVLRSTHLSTFGWWTLSVINALVQMSLIFHHYLKAHLIVLTTKLY